MHPFCAALPAGVKDFFKPFVSPHNLDRVVALFPDCTKFHFSECSTREIVAWVEKIQVLTKSWEDVMLAKDLKWILLAALTAPRGTNLPYKFAL